MSDANSNLLLRNDTVLGVCEAIGRDFGFHPNWLRLAFASLFYFFPMAVIGSYLGLGALVAVTRWIAPDGELFVAATATPIAIDDGLSTQEPEPVELAA